MLSNGSGDECIVSCNVGIVNKELFSVLVSLIFKQGFHLAAALSKI